MASTTSITVDLDDRFPLFKALAAFASGFQGEEETLHVIGGMAITLWGIETGIRRQGITEDIDTVITATVMDGNMAQYTRKIEKVTRKLGYARPDDWKQSRVARFQYKKKDGGKLELLCGTPTVGRPSKRLPAHCLFEDKEKDIRLYAAKTDWIDCVSDWVEVIGACGETSFSLRIPNLPALFALKIGAIRGKQERIDELGEKSPSKPRVVEYELKRLAVHIGDAVLLRNIIDARGLIPALTELCKSYAPTRPAAIRAQDWFDDHPSELVAIREGNPNLTGSPDPVRYTLNI